jgi:hypothetical protein
MSWLFIQLAFLIAQMPTLKRRDRENNVSPGCTVYWTQWRGGPQSKGSGVGLA